MNELCTLTVKKPSKSSSVTDGVQMSQKDSDLLFIFNFAHKFTASAQKINILMTVSKTI